MDSHLSCSKLVTSLATGVVITDTVPGAVESDTKQTPCWMESSVWVQNLSVVTIQTCHGSATHSMRLLPDIEVRSKVHSASQAAGTRILSNENTLLYEIELYAH